MPGQGIGASVLRKEDDRFLRGRGQYVADFRVPNTREVAFVRSSVAHGRFATCIFRIGRGAVFTARDLANVKPIRAATALSGFKHSSEPILAHDKVRYVGELVAICVAGSRAQAEDIAGSVHVDYEELDAVVDMLAARRPDAPLVHEEWGDNVFIEFFTDDAIERVAETAAIKVTREIRTARIACSRWRDVASSPIGMPGWDTSPSSVRPRCRISCNAAWPSAWTSETIACV